MKKLNGEVLRHLRLRAGMTQGQLQEKSGVTDVTIHAIEQNRVGSIKDDTLMKLAKGLDMDPVELDAKLHVDVQDGVA